MIVLYLAIFQLGAHGVNLDGVPENKLAEICWQGFQIRFNEILQDVVRFAKKIPGFTSFDTDDQINLIRGGCFEVRTLSHVTRSQLPDTCGPQRRFYDFFEREKNTSKYIK